MTRILITGKHGQLGYALQPVLSPLGEIFSFGHRELDLADVANLRKTIREIAPDIIVNAAAYTTVDKAETESELAFKVNAIAPGIMAEECRHLGALLIHYSTDYVFDGTATTPYTEDSATRPLNVYGASKLEGERSIATVGGAYLTLRTSWVFSARGNNFVLTMLKLARERTELRIVSDQIGAPTSAEALAAATLQILGNVAYAKERSGLYHLSASGHVARHALVEKTIELAKPHYSGDTHWANVIPITTDEYPLPAKRPLYSVLDNTKIRQTFGIQMPAWEQQLSECLTEVHAVNH